VSAGATGAFAYALFRNGLPESAVWAVVDVILLVVLLAPAAVLASFWLVLREVAEIPDRLARLPESARSHAEEVAALLDEATARRRRAGRRLLLIRRLRRQIQASRELLTPWAPILPLLRLPQLVAALVAALAAVAEAVAGLIVLVVLVL
jgi:hypothetical protein